MLICFVLFQTVLFSSFSGILFLICFTNCPPASWCFHIDASFSVTTCPHQKCFLRKHLKRPRIHQPYLSLHTSFFSPWTFVSHAFNFCLFFGGVTFVNSFLKSLSNLVDSSVIELHSVRVYMVNPQSWEIFQEDCQAQTAFPILLL